MNSKLKEEILDLIKNNFLESAEIHKNFIAVKEKVSSNFWKEVASVLNEKLGDEWKGEIDTKRFKHTSDYLLISKDENEDVFLYCRYGRIGVANEEIAFGIILNPKFLKPENGRITGTKIKHDLQNNEELKNEEMVVKLKNSKDGPHSIVYRNDLYPDHNKLNNELIAEILQNRNDIRETFEKRIFKFFTEYLSVFDQVVIQLEKVKKEEEPESFLTTTPSGIS